MAVEERLLDNVASRQGAGMRDELEQWQLAGSAPELYERYLVPAITGPWAADLVQRGGWNWAMDAANKTSGMVPDRDSQAYVSIAVDRCGSTTSSTDWNPGRSRTTPRPTTPPWTVPRAWRCSPPCTI